MKHDFKTYLILCCVSILSFAGSFFVPADDVIKAIAISPGIAALLAALFQILRDQAAFEKQIDIQNKQLQFSLGATSHMANVAFNKHVEFCELYMQELHKVMHTLYREAETPEALMHARNFSKFREDYALWLTNEVNINLEKFEAALRKLGAHAHFVKITIDQKQYADQRIIRIDQNHEMFCEILGLNQGPELNEDYAIEAIKRKVRIFLGAEELTILRAQLLKNASSVM